MVGLTVTLISSVLVPSELVTVSENTRVVNVLTVGAVNVAVKVSALLRTTVVPETCAQRNVRPSAVAISRMSTGFEVSEEGHTGEIVVVKTSNETHGRTGDSSKIWSSVGDRNQRIDCGTINRDWLRDT